MRYLSIFSGIEAASVAWRPLGWEPVAFCEVDDFCSEVLRQRFPDVPNLGDIGKVDWGGVVGRHGRPDVVVGGSPCTSFSIAGDRTGLQGESRLLYEYIRAVGEVRPSWFVFENVPAILQSRDNPFGQLVSAMADIGYQDLAWRVLDAAGFGVPQRRRRVFLVGRLGDGYRAAEVLLDPGLLRRDPQEAGAARQEASQGDGGRPARGLRVMASGQAHSEIGEDLCPTMSARQYKDPPILFDGGHPRRLTPEECEALMGLPRGWTRIAWRGKSPEDCPSGRRYKAVGNSFAVPVVRWIGEGIEAVA